MKRFSQQLKKQSTNIRLSAAEKSDLKDRLVAYMEYHPLPAAMVVKKVEGKIAAEPFRMWRFNTPQLRASVGVFAALALVIVPVVAERSVPGDVLYPVKVQFNEEVRSTLTLSPYQKVEWETERLERRIAEARLLDDEGKLTDEVRAEVAQAVKVHSDAAQAGIATISETDSDEAAIAGITFASALEVQSEVLESDLAEGDTGEGDVLAGAVESARADVAASQDGKKPSYEKLLARIEIESTRAQEFLRSLDEVIEESDREHVSRRLDDIAVKVGEATGLYNVEDEAVASASVALLTEVLTDVRKLISFMTDIDVKENVEVEDLVPVTLTLEERMVVAETALVVIEKDRASVKTLLPQVTDESSQEKITFGLELVDKAVRVAEADLATGTIAAAEPAIKEAQALLSDMLFSLALTGIEIGSVPRVVPVVASSTDEVASSTDAVASSTEEVIEEEKTVEATTTPERVTE